MFQLWWDTTFQVMQQTQQIAQQTQQIFQPAVDWLSRPRDPNCVTGATGTGSAIGAGAGLLGLAGGPTVGITEPTAIFIGGTAGWVGGMIVCNGGTGQGGGGSSSSGGGKNGWTNKVAREKAQQLGFREAKDPPFSSHSQLTFKSGSKWITPDVDGHTGYQTWKVFDSAGNRMGTYSTDLSIRLGK